VNEPANVLTTEEFARRLKEMESLGLKVEVLEEADLGKLGMNALLAVGMASVMPSKVVVMEWNGGGDEPPLAFVGKGVVFDTGGISLKPAAGMEDMTMDMGGAASSRASCGRWRCARPGRMSWALSGLWRTRSRAMPSVRATW
jgi:leucyl aminopeptidase